jgi:hypothetical protein
MLKHICQLPSLAVISVARLQFRVWTESKGGFAAFGCRSFWSCVAADGPYFVVARRYIQDTYS